MSKEKIAKTNALRLLDNTNINYTYYNYENEDGKIDGVSVALKLQKDPTQVFKTLVTQGHSKEYYVFVIPVAEELNLKKAAKAANEKNIEMIPAKDINKITGYIRGGCSPLGMKKPFTTFLEESAMLYDTVLCSAGKIGMQMELAPDDLLKAASAQYADLCK
jgi:Cys-tRNA(Pro)/Cys-tRNA(Cys) deacylase